MKGDFTGVPVLDLALARSPETKPRFLAELRDALVRVGFFYLKNHSIPEEVEQDAMWQLETFFNLPLEEKLRIERSHSKHFLGYTRLEDQKTAGAPEHNESLTLGPGQPAPSSDEPAYLNIRGPNQWPNEILAPGFRKALEIFLLEMQLLSSDFTGLIAEALELPASSLTGLLGDLPVGRLKALKYPVPAEHFKMEESDKGIAAHKDPLFMTYLIQDNEHECLEVQNKSGEWIMVPPIPRTVVVNIGRQLEILTRGVCTATTHRVILSSEAFVDQSGKPLGPRLAIPFFQHVDPEAMIKDAALDIPSRVTDLVKGENVISDAEPFYTGLFNRCAGDTVFTNLIASNPEASRKWYPELFPLALKKQAEARKLMSQKQSA